MITEIDKKTQHIMIVGITITAIILSLLARGHPLLQVLLTAIIPYLVTGSRPELIYSIIICIPRDWK